MEPDHESWRGAFELYLQAFKEPRTPAEQKKLARILKKPIPEELQKYTFEYQAFLRGLGRMGISKLFDNYHPFSPSYTGSQISRPMVDCTDYTLILTTVALPTSP